MVPKRRARAFGAIVVSLWLCIASLSPGLVHPVVAAYNGTNAAAWADTYWNHVNTPPPSPYFYNNGVDCANFVSISMHAGGGFPFVNNAYTSWWYSSPNSESQSWLNVPPLYDFLMVYWPGGFLWGTTSGNVATNYDTLQRGDLVFFDWGQGEGRSHVAMETGWGSWYDTKNGVWRSGDYIDQHTNDRYHEAWNGYYWNNYRRTTTVYQVHIDPTN